MTEAQTKQVESWKSSYNQNLKDYAGNGAGRICSLNVFQNPDAEDLNIAIVYTFISGLSDDYQPYIKTVDLLVEPDGNVLNLKDIFDAENVAGYMAKLKKIE